jgi:hypothetical protein
MPVGRLGTEERIAPAGGLLLAGGAMTPAGRNEHAGRPGAL